MRKHLVNAVGLLLATPAAASIDYVHVDGFEDPPDCSAELACPAQSSGEACVSGRLVEAGSGRALRAYYDAALTCAGGAVGGSCDLQLAAYDAIALAMNPGTAAPLAADETLVDGCGRYRISGISSPSFGFVAILADDASPTPSDVYVGTATNRPLGSGDRIDGVETLAVRRDTVERWTQSAGSPFGAATFADVGTLLLRYTAGPPNAGVTVTRDGNVVAANDYYFSDAAPAERLQLDPAQNSTGANGSALYANGAQAVYSGTGGGCMWPGVQGATVPGLISVLDVDC